MDALDKSDVIEQAMMTRIAEIYADALKQALRKKKAFLQKVKDVETGKIAPPAYYVQRGEEGKWRQGFYRELIRQNAVIDGIAKELDKAGVEATKLIRGSLVDIYKVNRDEAVDNLRQELEELDPAGIEIGASFAVYNKQQIEVLIREGQSPFSEIAYDNLGRNPVARRRLQDELAVATILGESQRKIIERIRRVTGQTIAQARRVAQTERNRVQSQARWEAGQEAADQGVEIENTWSARMVNTRDSHRALNGTTKTQGEAFHTIWGNTLRFPGDPEAPAREVINCHCALVPHVTIRKE